MSGREIYACVWGALVKSPYFRQPEPVDKSYHSNLCRPTTVLQKLRKFSSAGSSQRKVSNFCQFFHRPMKVILSDESVPFFL
jgi:hypothetical protein